MSRQVYDPAMANPPLHAPWRMDYIRTLDPASPAKADDCFICQAAAIADLPGDAGAKERRDRLVVSVTPLTLVIMNRFPYTNGHLLVAPRRHVAELEAMTSEELDDLSRQTVSAVKLLRRASSPQGFNVGMNLGRCAGAGLPGHIHQHVVPRWAGDVNFISVIGDVRIVPQALSQLYDEFRRVLPEIAD